MSVAIGIDGGQSEIRMRVAGDTDVLTAEGTSRLESDTNNAVAGAVATLWEHRTDEVSRVVLGLTTVPNRSADGEELAKRIIASTGAREVWIGGDQVTAHAGALPDGSGVVLTAGTGVGCLALDRETGAHRSFDGAGYLIGDEGGGFWIGRHGIRAVVQADEGRGPATSLSVPIEDRFGPIDGLPARLHGNDRAVNAIAHAATDVLSAAVDGDEVALAITVDAASRLATTAAAALAVLPRPASHVVALGGRLLVHGDILRTALVDRLTSIRPDAVVHNAVGSSLDGACLLAELPTPGPYAPLFAIHRRGS